MCGACVYGPLLCSKQVSYTFQSIPLSPYSIFYFSHKVSHYKARYETILPRYEVHYEMTITRRHYELVTRRVLVTSSLRGS